MRMLIEGHWLEAAQRRGGTVMTNHNTAILLENLPSGSTKTSGNSREGQHETLLDMTEQKTLLMSRVFPA